MPRALEQPARLVTRGGERGQKARCRCAVEALAIPQAASPGGVVTISIGVAVIIPVADASPMALVIEADGALYRAKAGGRNRVVTGASYQTA